jgi:hypothetical protein
MDVAQYRADKAARVERGEAKPVAAASIAPPVLPPETFVETAKEALAELDAVKPVHVKRVPSDRKPPTSWAKVPVPKDQGED